jgi:hypothetical protein
MARNQGPIEPLQVRYDETHQEKPDANLPDRHFSMEAQDIVAIGAVILCIGGVLVAVIMALGFVFGKVEGKTAEHIILGCVGGSAIAGVVAAIFGKGWRKRKG